jgi:hypothetical protein
MDRLTGYQIALDNDFSGPHIHSYAYQIRTGYYASVLVLCFSMFWLICFRAIEIG